MSLSGWIKSRVVPGVVADHGDVVEKIGRTDQKLEDVERRLAVLKERVEVVSQK